MRRILVACCACALVGCGDTEPRSTGTDTDESDTDLDGFGDGDDEADDDDNASPNDDDRGDDSDDDDDGNGDGNGDGTTGGPAGAETFGPDETGTLTDAGADTTGDPGCVESEWFRDDDGDGYGDLSITQLACDAPPGFTATPGDCDDGDASTHPGASETCDVVDNDCNGLVDELSDDNTGSCNGCNLGSRAGHSYYYCSTTVTWASAQATCEALGANLITIDDAFENNFIAGEPLPGPNLGFWIGANDIASEGTFAWADGTPWAFSNWLTGEPNDANGNEDCTVWAGTWNDVPCSDNSFAFICEGAPL